MENKDKTVELGFGLDSTLINEGFQLGEHTAYLRLKAAVFAAYADVDNAAGVVDGELRSFQAGRGDAFMEIERLLDFVLQTPQADDPCDCEDCDCDEAIPKQPTTDDGTRPEN